MSSDTAIIPPPPVKSTEGPDCDQGCRNCIHCMHIEAMAKWEHQYGVAYRAQMQTHK